MICRYCKKEAIIKIPVGDFCNDCAVNIYRNWDLNKELIKVAEGMEAQGIKRGSLRWVVGNIRGMKKVMANKRFKYNWIHEYKESGFWGTIKVMIAYYILS